MNELWPPVLVTLWSLCAIAVWRGVWDEVKTCRSRKQLYLLLTIGAAMTITGPLGWIVAGAVAIALDIRDKYRELEDK